MHASPDAAHLADLVLLTAAALELRLHAQLRTDDDEAIARVTSFAAEARARIEARAADADAELAATQLARAFSLSETEQQVIWLLAAVALRRQVRVLLSRCTEEPGPDPTLDGIRSAVYGDDVSPTVVRELGPRGTLRRYGLVERSDGHDGAHESRQTWTLSRRMLGFLGGDRGVAPELVELRGKPARELGTCFAASTLAAARRAVLDERRLVIASGLPGTGRRTLLLAAARSAGVRVLDVDARRLARDPARCHAQLLAIVREARLHGMALLFANLDALAAGDRLEQLASYATAIDGVVLATCRPDVPNLDWGRPKLVVEMESPTTTQLATLWRAALGLEAEDEARELANCYPLAPALVIEVGEAARSLAAAAPPGREELRAGLRTILDARLSHLARRLRVTQTWDDVVLARDHVTSLVELMARVRRRGTVHEQWGFADKVGKGHGIAALFSGPPGTGKTMIAGLVAQDLDIEIYQVDMAKVISKYIGETEQNLAALFDLAEASKAILLFDEADALFGKRTDVRSSNDRYANLETNYLLQRLESFSGICILTSNHETHIDPAFQRRLALHLRFALPDADERTTIWQAMLPARAPIAPGVDFATLGERYVMSGGYIKNAALRAAFLAAEEGSAISPRHLEYAARIEYEGMGKLVAGR